MKNTDEKLESLLLQHGLLKPKQLTYVRAQAQAQNKSIEAIIRSAQLVYPEPLAQLKAETLGVPYVDLSSAPIDPAAMTGISAKAAASYQFLAFGQTDTTMQVAMVNPSDSQARQAIRFAARKKGKTPQLFCASPETINRHIDGKTPEQVSQALKDFTAEVAGEAAAPAGNKQLQQKLEEAPVNKVFAVIIQHAIEGLASDVHIEPFSNQLRIRYRIDGRLHTSLILPHAVHTAIISRIKILAGLPITSNDTPQNGHFTFAATERAFSIRVNLMPTMHGAKVTLHFVDTSKPAPSFVELGLLGAQRQDLVDVLADPHGLVVVAGPGGAGKSTTMHAILTHLNTPDVSIASIEETIEYEVPGISQTQIQAPSHLNFARALHNSLRQDPDMIMVEEIRDTKTAQLVAKGALAGRLMLSMIPARNSLASIPRLIDLGLSPYVLSSSLRLLLSQRLIPKICQACKQETAIPKAYKTHVTEQLKKIPKRYLQQSQIAKKPSFYQGTGCTVCRERKNHGQIAVFEVIPITKKISEAITSDPSSESLAQAASQAGYLTLAQEGLLKALQGLVNFEDVIRVTN